MRKIKEQMAQQIREDFNRRPLWQFFSTFGLALCVGLSSGLSLGTCIGTWLQRIFS